MRQFRTSVQQLTELAAQTDRGMVLATTLVERLRQQCVLLPPLRVIERICASTRTRGIQRVYGALTEPLTPANGKRWTGCWSRMTPRRRVP